MDAGAEPVRREAAYAARISIFFQYYDHLFSGLLDSAKSGPPIALRRQRSGEAGHSLCLEP